MAACSVGVLLGCVVADVKDVSELAPLLFVPQMLFVGFFIRTEKIPVFLRWAQYLCSLKYAMNLILANEFRLSLDSCRGEARENCRNLLDRNSINTNQLYVDAIIIFVLFAAFRIAGAAILARKAKRFY